MRALRYLLERAPLLGTFAAGFGAVMLVYLLTSGGSASRLGALHASLSTSPHRTPAGTSRPGTGLIHISLGKGCGSARTHGHMIITRSKNGAMCAQGGTMYGELKAMHTPRAVMLSMLTSSRVTIPGVSPYRAEYQQLRGLGVPKKLARQLALHVVKDPFYYQP